MMSLISNFTTLYRQFNGFIKTSQGFRNKLVICNLALTGLFYPQTKYLALSTIGYHLMDYASTRFFNYLAGFYKPQIYEMHSYALLFHHFIHLSVDYTFHLSYLHNYEQILVLIPRGVFSFMNNFFWTNIWLKLMLLRVKTTAYSLFAISFVVLSPIVVIAYYKIVNLLRQHLTPYLVAHIQILVGTLQRSIDNGSQFRVEYNGLLISSYPEHPVQRAMTEEELEGLAPTCCGSSGNTVPVHFVETHCIICQEDYNEEKQLYRVLPKCGHSFHCHCVDKWFFAGHYNCPTCRTSVR